jgi:amidophosphoribosyltransferase
MLFNRVADNIIPFNQGFSMEEKREECGVFGIYGKKDCAESIFYGLTALQHRGQESCGIAMCNNGDINIIKGMGLVSRVFDVEKIGELKGTCGIGHVRYSTAGETSLTNAQPFLTKGKGLTFAISHNGNLVNFWELRDYWSRKGHIFTTSTDSEIISHIIVNEYRQEHDLFEAIKRTVQYLDGSYSLLILTPDELYAVRDPLGFRPLMLCELEKGFALASEDCAFRWLDASLVRDVKPGEIIRIDDSGLTKERFGKIQRKAHCMFEYVYFAMPDSVINGISVYKARKRLGHALARDSPVDADVVAAVPYSGVAAAVGYSEQSGIPYTEVLIRSRYGARSFIMPTKKSRDMVARTKLIPIREEVQGRDIVLVDDSIVRGTTMRQIVGFIRDAGAKSIHLRISCPPIIAPCFYGVDMQQYEQFIAVEKTVEEIREFIGVDSLYYNTVESLVDAIGIPRSSLCLACLSEEYPTELGHIKAKQLKLTNLPTPEQKKLG